MSEIMSPVDPPWEDEILVAQILLDLPSIIRERDSRIGFNWAVRKRRSRPPDEGPSNSRGPSREETPAAASPVTPLSFPPSESHSKKNSAKRSREKFEDSIEELTRVRNCLRREVEKVTKYYNELNAYNSRLKAMKQEVLQRKRESEMEIAQNRDHQIMWAPHLLVVDPTAVRFQCSLGPVTAQFYAPYNGPGPMGRIPDLNISAGQAFLDRGESRARYAEARRMRKGIIKIKSMRRACGIKLPETT